ncbi:MAG: PAS domain-containing protein [Capsulimonadales bacterium]|nr:PAS domain-containing protein [Capsulimonadales bacterium]
MQTPDPSPESGTFTQSKGDRHHFRVEYALMERALYASQSGILITDARQPDNPIIWCNPGFTRLTGYRSADILGKNCRFLQGPNTDRETVRRIRAAVRNGEAIEVEILNYRIDGTPFLNHLNVSPIRDNENVLTHFVGIQQEISERKGRSHEELQRAIEFAERVASTVREPLLILDSEFCVLSANLSFYRTFRMGQAETEGNRLFDLNQGEWNIPALRRLLEEELPKNQLVVDFEITHRFPNVGARTMLLNASAIPPDGEYPSRIFLAIEDITHRQDTLDGSVAFARTVIDSLAAHIAILDEEGTIVTVNQAWNAFARENQVTDPDAVVGVGRNYLNVCGAVHGEDARPASAMGEGIRAVMRGEIPLFEYEYPCHAPWERRWFLARVTRLEYGGRHYTVVAHENITQRKRSEEAQQESEEKYRLLAEGIPHFVWLADPAGKATYANTFFFEYTGVTPSEFEREGWMAPIAPEDLPGVVVRFTEAIRKRQPYMLEYRCRRASDNTYRWHQARVAPVFDVDDTVRQWVGTAVDVDMQYRAAEEREHHLNEIEALNARLRRAIQETHHRVKNNLQVINALLEMNSLNRDEPIPARELHRIMRHIGALATIHDLLTQQMRTGHDGGEVSARRVLEHLLALLAPSIAPRRLRVDLEEIPLPMQKVTSLAVLVNELVSNAIKHSRGQIDVSLWREGGDAALEICDDGEGFPEDFDPYLAANTGLELIESAARWDLRGEVRFDNRPDGGGRVRVTFPLES